MNRAALITEVNNYILSGGRRTTAAGTRTLLTDVLNSIMIRDSDANQNNGYMAISSTGIADISFIKSLTPLGYFLRDDGTWQPAAGGGSNLFATLTAGNSTGNLSIVSPDASSQLNIVDTQALIGYYGATIVGQSFASLSGSGIDYFDSGAGSGGSMFIDAVELTINHSAVIKLGSSILEWTSDNGAYGESYIYGDASQFQIGSNSNTAGIGFNASFPLSWTEFLLFNTGESLLFSSTRIRLDAPFINGTSGNANITFGTSFGAGSVGFSANATPFNQGWSYVNATNASSGFGATKYHAIDATEYNITHSNYVRVYSPNFTVQTDGLGARYGLAHKNGAIELTSYLDNPSGMGAAAWWGTKSAHDLLIFTNDGSAQAIFRNSDKNFALPNETADTIAHFDANTNVKSLSTATYPTLTELTYVKGGTSSFQAQLDALVSGLSWKQACEYASDTGENVDVTTGGLSQTLDGGVRALSANDRILLKNQIDAKENGIWLAQLGAWTRSLDADSGAELVSATVAISRGINNEDTQWVCTNNAPIAIGITNIAFVLVGGTTYVGTGNRITVTGNVIDISAAYDALWQPIDSDLTTIAGLSPSNDDFLQRKAGAWTNRSIAQVQSDLGVLAEKYTLAATFDGQGGVIAVNSTVTIIVPFTGTLVGWDLYETSAIPVSSSIVIDAWKDTYANYPPTIADTIWGTKPALSAAIKNQATGLAIAVTAGDVLKLNVDSVISAIKTKLIFHLVRSA